MKVFIRTCFLAFACFCCISAVGKGLFDNPVELFSGCLIPCLSHSERAKIQTTWRGFYLRADTQPGFKDEYSPSDSGIYLDVAVRDPKEIPTFKDSSTTQNSITKRTIEIPAPKTDQVALRISLLYGKDASKESLSSINASIQKIIMTSEQGAAANP
jgi:hypothetical protein